MSRKFTSKLHLATVHAVFAFACANCFCAFLQESWASAATHRPSQQTSPPQQQEKNVSPFASEIAEATRLYGAGKTAEAEGSYRELLQKAKGASDNSGIAEAHLGLGAVAYRQGKYETARSECEEALSLFNSLHDSVGAARVQEYFGNIAWQAGDNKTAREHYTEALKEFETAGKLREKAEVLLSLAYATDGYAERTKLETQALEIGRQLGDRRIQGQALHGMGQWLFVQGDAKGAEEKYKEAEALLDSPDDRVLLARVLHSEGRLLRAHGKTDDAIEVYRRALKMTEETGDKQSTVQVLNGMGAAYGDERKPREALAIFQQALELAKDMNLPPMTDMLHANIAESYINLGEYQRAVDILEEMNRRDPDPFPYAKQYRYQMLAEAYNSMSKYDLAMAAVTKSIEETKAHKNEQLLTLPLMLRARLEKKLGQDEAALADVREALKVIDDLRAHLVPSDFMKRGFVNRNQDAFSYSVQILHNLHQPGQALEVAEQARSRAFLDLLAARGMGNAPAPKSPLTLSAANEAKAPAASGANASVPDTSLNEHPEMPVTRGGATRTRPRTKDSEAAASLKSPASVSPPSTEQMEAIAKRLDSTVLSYWVTSDATYIWTLKSDGTVREARTEISQERLTKLVAATMTLGAEPSSEKAPQTAQANPAPTQGTDKHAGAIRLRGGSELVIDNSSRQAWRELYKLLIEPVRDSLPPPGSRLTIVPHGALFRLSFGALTDDRGRYLVEDYALSYTPALGLLQFTGARKNEIASRAPQYLLLADPQLSPSLLKDVSLPPLPNARLEAQAVARLFPPGSVSVLVAQAATKDAVEAQAPKDTVLHFATHAIVHDDQPFDSFLVLSAGSRSGDDGRLTVQEIYGLDLQADLVVLSACRTALGKVSGDGMLGLTRAFFYAGANSVVATLWDVADEPTSLLIADFYKNLRKGQDKSSALRSAQLHVLRELRAKRLKIDSPAGPLTLPEDPVFWAGFVLQGEP